MDMIYMVFAQMMQNKMRCFLAGATLMISTMFVILVLSISDAFIEGMNQNMEERFPTLARTINCRIEGNSEDIVGLNDVEITTFLNGAPEYITDIIRTSKNVYPVIGKTKKSDGTQDMKLYGVSSGYEIYSNIDMVAGRFITNDDCLAKRKCLVVSVDYLNNMDIDIKDAINKKVQLYSMEEEKKFDFYIIGVYEHSSDDSNYMYCVYNFWEHKSKYTSLKVIVDYRKNLSKARNYIEQYLKKREINDTSYSYICMENNMVSMIENMLKEVKILFVFVSALTMCMSVVGISNIMLTSILERYHEIGIKKAIGCSNKRMKLEVVLETMLISVFGCVLSVVIAKIILALININMDKILRLFHCTQYDLHLELSIYNVFVTVILVFLASIGASYVPAKNIESLEIITALERE